MPAENPYFSSGAQTAPDVMTLDQGLEYQRSVKFVWENPNWLANVLFAALCSFLAGAIVPILPGLVLIGYQCEMLEALFVRPRDPYPDFKVDRIMEYLVRGVWPFVVGLLASIVIVPLILLVIAIPVVAMAFLANAAGEDGAKLVVGIMLPFIVVIALVTACLLNIALVPFLLRAALTQDIGASLDFQFAKDFVGRMWKETVLVGLFLIGLALAAQVVGLLLLCVGVLVTVPFVQFAQVHLAMQLYRLYLARGGEKIPLKSIAAVPAA